MAEFHGDEPIQDQRDFVYEAIGFDQAPEDQYVRDLFWDAFYNDELTMDTRESIMEDLADYLWDEYGIDFELIWDWDDFREWYASV
jgi:hypothetical protein